LLLSGCLEGCAGSGVWRNDERRRTPAQVSVRVPARVPRVKLATRRGSAYGRVERFLGRIPTERQRPTPADLQEQRRAAGEWLRKLREERGLSQRDLARLVGADYYTLVSQLESGRGRVPPERYSVWAQALEVEAKVFVKTLMQYYDPVTYALLFPE
jgi:DNA-binding XRE family transcriptional regulator